MPKFVRPNEAANTLGVCLRTLRRWEAEGSAIRLAETHAL